MQHVRMNAICVVNMINTRAVKNRLIYLYIILIAFIPSPYVMSISGARFNADRLFFVIMVGCGLLFFITSKRYKLNRIQLFLVLYFFIVLFNNLFIGQLQLMSVYISALLILLASNELRIESLIRAIHFAFYAYFFWAGYSLVQFFISGPVVELPFSSYLPGFFETKLEHAKLISASYSIFPRVSFPYATPPMLSAVGALYFFFYRFLNNLYDYNRKDVYGINKASINFGIFFSIMIVMATVSRTGTAILVAGLFTDYVVKIGGPLTTKSIFQFIFKCIAVFVSVWALLLIMKLIPELDWILSRMFSSTSAFDSSVSGGHLSVRIMGLQHFLELDWLQKLFGIGYLNFTGLHYHSSFLTALIEIGLIGSVSLIGIVLYPAIKAAKVVLKRSPGISRIYARYMIVTSASLFMAHVVYEMPYVQSLWFFWALAVLLSREGQSE